MDAKRFQQFQDKARALIDSILSGSNFEEKEIVLLAAALQIADFVPRDEIIDELSGAKHYIDRHRDTGDDDYLIFAQQRMDMAKKPLSVLKARLHYATQKDIEHYNRMIEWAKELEPALMDGRLTNGSI